MNRVQKGNTLFRPVAKARPRATPARTPSVTPSASQQTESHSSAKPPPSTHETEPSATLSRRESLQIDQAPLPVPPAVVPAPTRQFSNPPLIQSTQSTSVPLDVPLPSTHVSSTASTSPSAAPTPSIKPSSPPLVQGKTTEPSQPTPPVILSSNSVARNPSVPVTSSPQQTMSSQVQANGSENSSTQQQLQPPSTGETADKVARVTKGDVATGDNADSDDRPSKVAPLRHSHKRSRSTHEDTKRPSKRKKKSPDEELASGSHKQSRSKAKTKPISKKGRSSHVLETPSRSRGDSLNPRAGTEQGENGVGEEEEADPLLMTMAALVDSSHGKTSSKAEEIQSNFQAWKSRNKQKREQLRAAMERKKRGLPEDDEPAIKEPAAKDLDPSKDDEAQVIGPMIVDGETEIAHDKDNDESGLDFDYTHNLTQNRYNVQVRIGPNGETIIDEESLVVDRAEPENAENYTHVVESDATKFTNSASYGRKLRGSRWSAEETELFYNALSQYGQNFELIACVMPGRDRKACKNKFKAEDKKNPGRITSCLKNNIPVDMVTLSRMTGKDFSGPTPEIKIPERIVLPGPIEPQASEPESDFPSTMSKKSRKRSRSSTAPLGDDGVQIIGSADMYVEPSMYDQPVL